MRKQQMGANVRNCNFLGLEPCWALDCCACLELASPLHARERRVFSFTSRFKHTHIDMQAPWWPMSQPSLIPTTNDDRATSSV
jgi:hypothetical protein